MDGTDDALLRHLRDGREESWAELYDRSAPRLFRAAWGLLNSREEAEDAVQEVFVGLARARGSLMEVRNLDAYLFSSLRRACGQMLEQRSRVQRSTDAAQAVGSTVESPVDYQAALAALPLEQREVIVLKIDGGLTFEEVADALAISPNTAASRYRYALEKLRGILEVRTRE
ncbi:MAG: sigma-70 family RNA polymerase sigma factor [Planctomycetes bacterium]|nr:sigma-70 family RNA polymerase sigma factor [Planctomycetota bacterium]